MLSESVTVAVLRVVDPADIPDITTENVSSVSIALSAKIGKVIVSDVSPAKIVTVPVVAVKSDPAVAVSPDFVSIEYVTVISSLCALFK